MEKAPGIVAEFSLPALGDTSDRSSKSREKPATAFNICVATPGMRCCADGIARASCGLLASVRPGGKLNFSANRDPVKSLIPWPDIFLPLKDYDREDEKIAAKKLLGEQMGVPLCSVMPTHPCCRNGQLFPHCYEDIPRDPKHPDVVPQILRVAIYLPVPVKN